MDNETKMALEELVYASKKALDWINNLASVTNNSVFLETIPNNISRKSIREAIEIGEKLLEENK